MFFVNIKVTLDQKKEKNSLYDPIKSFVTQNAINPIHFIDRNVATRSFKVSLAHGLVSCLYRTKQLSW